MLENTDDIARDAERLTNPDERQIVERIYAAVMEQRLPPKTKLSESKLCETFGVGRMRVRRALLLLSSQGIVELHSNRGAFVASPDLKDARDVFDARLALEPGIVLKAAAVADRARLDALEAHIRTERQAAANRNRRDAIRLSGEFHVKLAAATGNAVLTRMMRELVTRTSLIIGLYGTSGASNCAEDEHAELLAAIRAGDGARAEALMRTHLAHIEADLDLTRARGEKADLVAILSQD